VLSGDFCGVSGDDGDDDGGGWLRCKVDSYWCGAELGAEKGGAKGSFADRGAGVLNCGEEGAARGEGGGGAKLDGRSRVQGCVSVNESLYRLRR